jgi:hypothetical protein
MRFSRAHANRDIHAVPQKCAGHGDSFCLSPSSFGLRVDSTTYLYTNLLTPALPWRSFFVLLRAAPF